MRLDARAVVFDLDDTLYPYRRFLVSGFAAVASEIEARIGLDRRLAFRALHRASRGPAKRREVQELLAQYDLPALLAEELVSVLRHHEPALRQVRSVGRLLTTLRSEGWRIGVLTNGAPSIQARKVRALRLEAFVDAVVYAAETGSGAGKPECDAFAEVARRLGVPANRTVMVGDDERADIDGALMSGMRAIRCDVWRRRPERTGACPVIHRFRDLPALLGRFVQEDCARHAA